MCFETIVSIIFHRKTGHLYRLCVHRGTACVRRDKFNYLPVTKSAHGAPEMSLQPAGPTCLFGKMRASCLVTSPGPSVCTVTTGRGS
jgi:hypothetical protein